MLKKIALTVSICALIFTILAGTSLKPFKTIKTMAQQYAEDYLINGRMEQDQEIDHRDNNDQKQDEKTDPQPRDKPVANGAQPENDGKEGVSALEQTTITDKNGRQIVTNSDSLLVLVNKQRNLSPDYVPDHLVVPDVPFPFKGDSPQKYLREEAARALEALFQAAGKEDLDLYAASGYRSYDTQKTIFENNVQKKGEEVANQTSAYPGQSEHQTGLAMDLTSSKVGFQLEEKFGELKEGQWLKENAHRFGFIIRYPKGKEDLTGYSYEPWHLRFVGKEAAAVIYEKDITLEEFLGGV